MHRYTSKGTLSSLVKKYFFGFNFERVHDDEIVGADGTDPCYIHVATRCCLIDIFQIEDSSRQLCKLTELEYPGKGYTQWLTGRGILRNESNQSVRCYGWEESNSTTTWIFNDSSCDNTPFQRVTLPRPLKVRNEDSNRLEFYVLPQDSERGWRLTEYFPTSIYVSDLRITNFKILASRLCIKNNTSILFGMSS